MDCLRSKSGFLVVVSLTLASVSNHISLQKLIAVTYPAADVKFVISGGLPMASSVFSPPLIISSQISAGPSVSVQVSILNNFWTFISVVTPMILLTQSLMFLAISAYGLIYVFSRAFVY